MEEAAEKLGKSKRTVQRLVKKWEEEGLEAIAPTNRSDKAWVNIVIGVSQLWRKVSVSCALG
ncbi:MAG: helix-turn-helix domain-containing protein [Crocosphaera sp.]